MGSLSTQKFDTIISATKNPSSRRTPSFSSSSSSSLSSLSSSLSSSLGSLYFEDESPFSPVAPVRFSGIPFSWERLPGISKKLQNHKKKESIKLLPLPPPPTPPTSKKNSLEDLLTRKKTSTAAAAAAESFRKDPFFTALVECSKDDDDDDDDDEESASKFKIAVGAKVTRSICDRFGFINLYTCCKRTCAVFESIVYLPSSTGRTANNYGLSNRSSR